MVAHAFPGLAGTIPEPIIPANYFNVTNYGATGDGITDNTAAIQSAINAAKNSGGGTVEIPPGTYLSGPIALASSINFQIDSGATLKMLPYGTYPGGASPTDFISANRLHDVELSGGGIIDGQGAAWWSAYKSSGISRPKAMFAPSGCLRVLVQDITFQNPPNTHISFRSTCGNVTVRGITIATADGTPNTDGIDLSATNCVIRDSSIRCGDDNIAISDSHNFVKDVLVTNCFCGTGHGISIGSYTHGGVSNLIVTDCAFSGTGNGIRLKCQRGRGGLVQNLFYSNLRMTNVDWPLLIYSYYNFGLGTLTGVDPAFAAREAATNTQSVTTETPIWRNITFSNITATATASSRPPLMIWGLPEMAVSNVVFQNVNITSPSKRHPGIYNASGIRFVDSQFNLPASSSTMLLYNAQVEITNSSIPTASMPLDGLTTNNIFNALALHRANATISNTNVLDGASLALDASALTINNNLNLNGTAPLNFSLGTSDATIHVTGRLALSRDIHISAGAGFTNGSYTIFSYGGGLDWESPALLDVPDGFNAALDTNTVGLVKVIIAPLVNTNATKLDAQITGNFFQINWPADHTGWRLEVQTNDLDVGLSSNWTSLGFQQTNMASLPIASGGKCVFYRLVYP
ncbi:MAG TPA: glycosyl hydrolase family 28 protein [Verrucomicrobiae bacterium]|nr:glycosyl hydrolase family 28 protein [Verrucomicrobiae bacterium]